MAAPTKEAIIGTFVNGRNGQNDFLQLASSMGGTVFAWIDYQGFLQGTFANSVTPGGASGNVQFNNAGVFGGDSGFSYDSAGHRVVLGSTTGLVFGGETSSNAGIFITGGTTVAARLADNSADAQMSASALTISGTGLTTQVPVTIIQKGTGPTNVSGAALFITDGVTPGVGTYFLTSGNTFRIRNDSTLQSQHGDFSFQPSGLSMNGGNGSGSLILYTGAPSGGYSGITNQSAQVDLSGAGLFAITANPGAGDHGEILLNPFTNTISFFGDVSGNAAIGTATVAGTPNKINIPLTTASVSGMFLISDGGNPQQTSWSNVMPFVSAPSTATSAGTTGQIAFDATHFYVCISTNVWVRGTLATF